GIYQLAADVEGVEPMHIAAQALDESTIGKRFSAMGYGIQDHTGTKGVRKAGALTVRAFRGAPLMELFPTLDDYLAHNASLDPSLVTKFRHDMEIIYDNSLAPGFEVLLGGTPNDVQVCGGDSGSPLLSLVDGH